MAYVGNSPTQQSFTGGVDQYNGNNSNTVFGLTRTINTVYDVDAYVENVWQRPTTGYTVSANTITFTSAPPAGSNNVVVVYRNFSATSIVPQQGSVTHTAFAANAVPTALGYMPANKAGDTFSGAVSGITTLAAGNTTITGFANVVSSGTTNVSISSTSGTGKQWDLLSHSDGRFLIRQGTIGYAPMEIDPTTYTVGFNGTSPSLIIQGGIQFPSTQVASANANTLDDYEEGSWTALLYFGGSNTGIVQNLNAGVYTKIGNIVYATGVVMCSNLGSATGGPTITGLPFSARSNPSQPDLQVGVAVSDTSPTKNCIYAQGTTISWVNSTKSDFAINQALRISITYIIT